MADEENSMANNEFGNTTEMVDTEPSESWMEYEDNGLLEPIVLPAKKIASLPPGIFNDYFNKTGMFSLDPVERAEGQRKYRQHRFWDYGRVVAWGIFLGIVLNDVESLIAPAVYFLIAFLIIARICGGKWWEI